MRPRFHNNVSLARWAFSILLLVAAVWIFHNRQYVYDEITLRQFQPTDEVVRLAESTSMTSQGVRYFYASRPQVEDRQAFNDHCQTVGEQSIILGCYVGLRIYLYDITDERLNGVKEVTAAHEMLHAAYDRLSAAEKRTVNDQLLAEVKLVEDERILGLIASYQKSDPHEIENELHSILGTELRELSPGLEQYYARYFSDRAKVVSYAEAYEGVFASLKKEQQQLAKRLDTLNGEIDSRSKTLNNNISQLNSDVATFNRRAQSGEFNTQAEFNAERARLLNRQQELRTERSSINALIAEFNSTRQKLLSLGVQAKELNQALDSTPDEVPSI